MLFSEFICCIHVNADVSDDHIVPFRMETLQKCDWILRARKMQNLRYNDVVLPKEVDGKHGFHIKCYRKFLGLSKKQKEKMMQSEADVDKSSATNAKDNIVVHKSPVMRSNVKITKPSAGAGIFPVLCLFCKKKTKKT